MLHRQLILGDTDKRETDRRMNSQLNKQKYGFTDRQMNRQSNIQTD